MSSTNAGVIMFVLELIQIWLICHRLLLPGSYMLIRAAFLRWWDVFLRNSRYASWSTKCTSHCMWVSELSRPLDPAVGERRRGSARTHVELIAYRGLVVCGVWESTTFGGKKKGTEALQSCLHKFQTAWTDDGVLDKFQTAKSASHLKPSVPSHLLNLIMWFLCLNWDVLMETFCVPRWLTRWDENGWCRYMVMGGEERTNLFVPIWKATNLKTSFHHMKSWSSVDHLDEDESRSSSGKENTRH